MPSKRYPLNIPADLYEKLKQVADEEGLTIHAVILNAIKFYLERRSEADRVGSLEKRVERLEKAFNELRAVLEAVIRRMTVLEGRAARYKPFR